MRTQTPFSMKNAGGPATKAICLGTIVASALFAVLERQWGFGSSDLIFTVDGIMRLELWRLVTYPYIELEPFGLVIGVIVLFIFGGFFEKRWGSRDFVRFFLVSSLGGALLAIPFGMLVDLLLPFRNAGGAAGPDAALDAMLVAMALIMPDSNILLGFVLPIKARTVVYLFLGFQVLVGLMTGAASLGITLGGMAMGYFLVTGNWRPTRMLLRFGSRGRKRKRRNSGLYVVDPPDDKETLN